MIDWKTSKKPKRDIRQCFDNPLQLAAYLGAYNSHTSLKAEVKAIQSLNVIIKFDFNACYFMRIH